MSKPQCCVDCSAIAVDVDTSYTLIARGWRVSKRETPEGIAVEWRCKNCWQRYKRTQPYLSSGAFRTAPVAPESERGEAAETPQRRKLGES